jgi:dethiobiotin synthetase
MAHIPPLRLFVSAVGTGVGKTFLCRGLARSALRQGLRVAALKPLETGVDPDPLDALALARAARRPEHARDPAFYRAAPPLAPYAAALEGGAAAPDFDRIVRRIRELADEHDALIVEGAGGLLVPIDRARSTADLVGALELPIAIDARDELGVLSSVLTCVESARGRRLRVAAVILSQHATSPDDPSPRTNQRVLQERLECPVLHFPSCVDDDDALADLVDRTGLAAALQRSRPR